MNSHQLQTEIEIDATPERVWAILVDFAAYPEWNPFIRLIRGVPRAGARLEVRIQPSGAKAMSFRPTVCAAVDARELRWLGRVLLPGIFDGEHRFELQPLAVGKTQFRHGEHFRGLLVPFLRGSLERDTKRGFEEMNRALKVRAEAAQALARAGAT